ncbi:cache domain-containing protein [Natronincola ferrireducens]|uniref:histidine kinase n=1 Tax=Natronincola ferrireducens TaxID=393762 RepID=A0A1G8X9H5_9FIRM|nr:cache domain-containing protein [Natronincola ferrireducens]SDJ86400.1 His Kinase A (phospho-acceptor) domain-containing protein [Natronincola ferrireducens]
MKSFSSRIVFIFVILVIFIVFIFSMFNILDEQKIATKIMEENLKNLVYEKKSILDLRMRQVELEVEELAYWLESYEQMLPMGDIIYDIHKDGTYLEYGEEGNISLFVNSKTKLTEEIEKQIFYTKKLEDNFKRTINKNQDIVCVYTISNDGLLRVYPNMYETQLNSEYDFRKDYYFRYAIEETKGEGRAVWTKPYYDVADRGLVVTCAYPIYSKDKLQYVIFADVTLELLQKEIADFNIARFGYGFLIDDHGEIIYHPDYLEKPSKKGEELKNNILSLSNNEEFKFIIEDMIGGQTGQAYYFDEMTDSEKFVTYAPIEGTKWSVALVVNSNDYSIDIRKYLGRYFIGPLVIIIIFSMFVYMALKKVSNYLVELSYRAERVACGELMAVENVGGGDEIVTIANSLNTMSSNLKNHMESLIKTNTKLEAVFNSIKGVLFVIDKNYKLVNVNKLGRDIIKKDYPSFPGIHCFEFFKGCLRICEKCPVTKTMETGKESFKEMIWDNEIYHVRTYPILDEEGNIDEIVVYSTKETERAIIEREFHQREKLASIGQVSAAITHELRNPIAIINGSSYLLKDMVDSIDIKTHEKEEFHEILKEIDNSIKNSLTIINELLDFSRKSTTMEEKVDIIPLIRQILMIHKKNIVENNIVILEKFNKEEIWVFGNLDSLRLIFINLIDNALYEMKNGGTLIIKIDPLYDEGKVKLILKDTGKGMEEEVLSNIFKPFYTTKPRGIGNGIGMWLVYREIKNNKGTINIQSQLGKGTKVEINFNLYEEDEGGKDV